jgi:hypothetical protein
MSFVALLNLVGLVVREMHCAAAMCRNFRWTDVNLWASELPQGSTVVLGGMDGMIPVAEVRSSGDRRLIACSQREGALLDLKFLGMSGHPKMMMRHCYANILR